MQYQPASDFSTPCGGGFQNVLVWIFSKPVGVAIP